MAAEIGPREETIPDPPRYDRAAENRDIVKDADEFENRLNTHVDPWISLFRNLVMSRLHLGLVAFVVLVPLSIVIFIRIDGSFWLAAAIVVSPLVFAAWTSGVQGLATTCGNGARPSEGLTTTCAELRGILKEARECLERKQEVGEERLGNESNHSSVDAVARLCTARMMALLMHQKAIRRVNVLNDTCDTILVPAQIVAVTCPLVLILLAAAIFVSPFLLWGATASWATVELLGTAALLTAIGLVTSFLSFVMTYNFVRSVQHKLADTVRETWTIDPSDFDSTGQITKRLEDVLDELERCNRALRHMKAYEST